MYYDSKYSVNVYLMRYVAFFSTIPGLVLCGNSGMHATRVSQKVKQISSCRAT